MLSIGKLAAGPGAGLYYVDQVALGAEDYYAGEGEAPGQWTGRGADALGLSGDVREVQIVRLLEGRDPASSLLLRRPLASGAVAGFDLTFRAPKSVSVVFGIADGDVVRELRAAHSVAVEQALRYLERDACRVRLGAGGAVKCLAEGFVAARFEHRSSRAGDPFFTPTWSWPTRLAGRMGDGPLSTGGCCTGMRRRPATCTRRRTALTRGGRGVEAVRAPAGAGKTFALDAAREAWQASGVAVLGCALSARAACELRDQAGLEATTIARLTRALDRGVMLSGGAVVIVDEAGMVGTRDLARLADAVAAAEGKLVLVGDDRQLPEIEAGGLFAAIADQVGALELRQVRRQRDAWDRDALAALRVGDVDRFVREYERHGRIVAASSAEAARARLVEDWLTAGERGERAVMIANRRADVADLNRRARELLRSQGRLEADELTGGTRAFAVGDRVLARRNDRRLGVINGDAGRVTAITGEEMTVELDDGRRRRLPAGYVLAGHLDHGYALTAHLAQDATVDRAFVLGSDELYREWGYTALSRHRIEARFYLSATREFLNRTPAPVQAGDAVTRMLLGSRAHALALQGVVRRGQELEAANRRLADIDVRIAAIDEERAGLPWHRRARRRELDALAERLARPRELARRELDRLTCELEATRAAVPRLSRATDPLARLDRARERPRERVHDFGWER